MPPIVCTGDWVTFYPFEVRGTVERIKPLPYQMVSYLINGQWYSNPELKVYSPHVPISLQTPWSVRAAINKRVQQHPIVKVNYD